MYSLGVNSAMHNNAGCFFPDTLAETPRQGDVPHDYAPDKNLTVVEVAVGRVSDVNMASRKAEEAASRRFQAASWLKKIVGSAKLSPEPSEEELRLCLRNGALLCRLMNKIEPNAVTKVVETSSSDGSLSAFQCFENLRNFLVAAQELRLPTFEISDLEQVTGSLAKVVDCILALKSFNEWRQTGALGSWKYAGSLKSPLRGNVYPRGHGKPIPTDFTYKNSRKRLLPPDSYVEAELPLSEEPTGLLGHRGQTHERHPEADPAFDIENCPAAPDSTSTWINHLSFKFRELLQVKPKPMQDLTLQDNHSTLNGLEGSSPSFATVVRTVLGGKQADEIPGLVELMIKKVVEEFQYRLLAQGEQIKKLKSSLNKTTVREENSSKLKEVEKLVAEANQEIMSLKVAFETAKREAFTMQQSCTRELQSFEAQILELARAAAGYHKVLSENRKLYNEVQDLKGNIRVYCRVRPSGSSGNTGIVDFIGDNGEIMLCNPSKLAKDARKSFTFNKVFGTSVTQEAVFLDTQPLIRSVLDGYNVCIFAYGQTGSGKTYTMSGPDNLTEETWGVNYRALNDLFAISHNRQDLFQYEIVVQMIEIYNEHLRDLLAADAGNKKLEIRNSSQQNGINVPDATMMPVNSTADVLELMKVGQKNRAVGSTAMNERSSRSHSVLTVHVRGKDLSSGAILHGCLHLVDLAGSERVDKSEATGERLKEAQYINKSLAALGDVISALSQKNAHVPYRNSKLTQLLQDSLGGQAKTLMFVHMSPDIESFSETMSTLKFAERVATVELGAARTNRESGDVRDLKEQLTALKDAISKKDAEIEKLKLIRSNVNDISGSGERQKLPFQQSYDVAEYKAIQRLENQEAVQGVGQKASYDAHGNRSSGFLPRARQRGTPLRGSLGPEAGHAQEEWQLRMEDSSQSSILGPDDEIFESCLSSDSGKQEDTCCPPLTFSSSPSRGTPQRILQDRVLNSKNTLSVSSVRHPRPKPTDLNGSQKLIRKSAILKASTYSDQNSDTSHKLDYEETISDSSDRENRHGKEQKPPFARKAENLVYGRSPASIKKPQSGSQWRTPLQSQKLRPSDPRHSQGAQSASTRRYSSVGLPADCSSVKRSSLGGRSSKETTRAPEGSKPAFARHLFAIPNGSATKPAKS